MKKGFIFATIFLSCLISGLKVHAQQVDPLLTAAVIAQTEELKGVHKTRKKIQEKIIDYTAAATVAMDRVHSVEKKMLDYLSNASHAVANLYQIKRAAELVGVEIPKNISLLTSSIPDNPQGTVVTALVTKRINRIYEEMASLYPFMAQLVTSGSYTVRGDDGGDERHKVNLLNSAERYYIADTIVNRLESINTNIFLLAWQVKTYSWRDLWYEWDPEGMMLMLSGRMRAQHIIDRWKHL